MSIKTALLNKARRASLYNDGKPVVVKFGDPNELGHEMFSYEDGELNEYSCRVQEEFLWPPMVSVVK